MNLTTSGDECWEAGSGFVRVAVVEWVNQGLDEEAITGVAMEAEDAWDAATGAASHKVQGWHSCPRHRENY